MLQEIVR